jgi:hypothetical protein
VELRAGLDSLEIRKNIWSLPGTEPRFLGHRALSLVVIPTELSRLFVNKVQSNNVKRTCVSITEERDVSLRTQLCSSRSMRNGSRFVFPKHFDMTFPSLILITSSSQVPHSFDQNRRNLLPSYLCLFMNN